MLVNTHHHGDHTNGNCLLPFATIVGHERCRQSIMETGILRIEGIWEPVEWGTLTPAPPFVTFEEHLHVYVDDLLVELLHFGTAAHTTNDVVAWIPERKVLFTGDLVFNGGTPFVLMGSVAGSLATLAKLAELDAEVLVPGHGEPCSMAAVDDVVAYLRFVQATAHEGTREGWSPLEAARRDRPRPVRGADGQRAARREPAPRLCRARRRRAGCADRPRRCPRRHGRVQRRGAPALRGVTPAVRPDR